MPLVAGQTLTHYEILSPLGAGAMGEVYRARDTRLDREVALKVLPEEFAGDEERLRRFEREAKALASLNHPNVAQVFGIDQVGDICFMAMEFVPGEDLASRLSHGGLSLGGALDVCRQIAEGVEAAHEAGVIHRDLKPANVILAPDGQAKVLDFGLAKPGGPAREGSSMADSALSTDPGRLLGTPTYMAPEQARGRPIDRRVDVWAFGCVLYECLTGRRAFAGDVLGEVIVAVLEKEPDWSGLPLGTPAHVRTLLSRCLDKDPRGRLRDIGEARVLLEHEFGVKHEVRPASTKSRPPLATGALVIAALVVGVLAGRLGLDRSSGDTAPEIRQQRLTERVGMEEMPAVSPDGGKVAFVSRVNGIRQVFVRLVETGSPRRLTRAEVDCSFPRWVNEDELIYFLHPERGGEPGSLWRMDFLGSSPPKRILDDALGEADVDHEGRWLATFRTEGEEQSLILVDLEGEEEERSVPLPPGVYSSPRWSPDGRRIAFEDLATITQAMIRVLELEGEESRAIARAARMRGIAWLPDGSGLVYSSSEGSTLAYPPVFSLRTVSLDGTDDARLPLEGGGYASYVEPDVTVDGRLVASRIATESDIYRYPVDGTPRENVENAKRITYQTGLVQVPTAGPAGDDEEVAYLSDSGGHGNVWVARVDGSQEPRQITFETDPDTVVGIPLWSPDDDWIVYWRGVVNHESEEWLVSPDGNVRKKLVSARGGAAWSHDGAWLYYTAHGEDPLRSKVMRIPVDGGDPVLVRERAVGLVVSSDADTAYFSPGSHRHGEVWKASPPDATTAKPLITGLESRIPLWPHRYELSPDDAWLATALRDRGTTNLWIFSTEDGSPKQITDFGERATTIGRQVSWSSDGKFLFAALMETDADIVLLERALP